MRTALSILAAAFLLQGQQGKLAALLPDPAAFGGKAASAAALYGADLYNYIDGGAEAYHKRCFVMLAHREYKVRDIDLTADVYDMGTPEHARAMYAAERSPESRSIGIGDEGYEGEGFLNFVQGRYYVRIIAFGEKSNTKPALEAAAKSISGTIHG